MAVNTPNPGIFLQQIGTDLVTLRDAFAALKNRNDYIASMGGATFLTSLMGLTAPDANALVAALGNHASLGVQYNGGAVAPFLDYRANGEPFWGQDRLSFLKNALDK